MLGEAHRDGHVEVDKSYYSVPPEYLGRRVWVRLDTRLVRVLDQRFDEGGEADVQLRENSLAERLALARRPPSFRR
ncbi:MAG: Mu transposase domain-containing protein [Planctomycetota bacterium]